MAEWNTTSVHAESVDGGGHPVMSSQNDEFLFYPRRGKGSKEPIQVSTALLSIMSEVRPSGRSTDPCERVNRPQMRNAVCL